MEYLDFELEIGVGQGRDYPVEVVHSPAGERRGVMRFPFDELELENHLLRVQNALLQAGSTRRRIASPGDQAVQDFGQALFDALIVNDIRSSYEVSRLQAEQQGKGLRIKLRVQDPALAALPWEFLYDARQTEFLALSRYTPIVRYLDLPRAIHPLPVSPPLKILGMIASPSDLPPLNVERERLRVERAVASLQGSGLVELTWLEGGTWQDMQRAMRRGPWHIFHFVGHGRFDAIQDEGVVALIGEDGATDELSAVQLGRLLADHPSLRLVMLNACEGAKGGKTDIFSGTAATLVRRGIPAVVAMQYEITDRAAIEFARTFYEAVSDEMPLDAAVAEARKAVSVSISNTVEWGTPVLFMRSPDGVLFRVQDRERAHPTGTHTLPPVEAATKTDGTTAAPEAPFDPKAFEAELRRRWEAEERERDAAAADEPAAEPAASPTPPQAPEPASAEVGPLPTVTAAPEAPAPPAPAPAPPAPAPPAPAATPPAPPPREVATRRSAPGSGPVPGWPGVQRPPSQPPHSVAAGPTPTPPARPQPAARPATQPVAPRPAQSPPATVEAGAQGQRQFTVAGRDGELMVSPHWVGIRRRPANARRPDRTEPMARLAAVHLAETGQGGEGFIQLCFQGEDPSRVSFWVAGSAPSTILFAPHQQAQFASAKQWLEYYVALARRA